MGKIKIQTSWDDYSEHNIKLAEMLLKYELPAIFFIDLCSDNAKQQVVKLAKMGFEIGAHTYNHPQDLKLLHDDQLKTEIIDVRKELQSLTGQEINWFCYPRGRYDDRVMEFVKEAGYKFARTTRVKVENSIDNLAFPTSFHCYNRAEYNGKEWPQYVRDWIEFLCDNFKAGSDARNIHFWGHAWEIEKYGDWEKLEKLFAWIKDFNGS